MLTKQRHEGVCRGCLRAGAAHPDPPHQCRQQARLHATKQVLRHRSWLFYMNAKASQVWQKGWPPRQNVRC